MSKSKSKSPSPSPTSPSGIKLEEFNLDYLIKAAKEDKKGTVDLRLVDKLSEEDKERFETRYPMNYKRYLNEIQYKNRNTPIMVHLPKQTPPPPKIEKKEIRLRNAKWPLDDNTNYIYKYTTPVNIRTDTPHGTSKEYTDIDLGKYQGYEIIDGHTIKSKKTITHPTPVGVKLVFENSHVDIPPFYATITKRHDKTNLKFFLYDYNHKTTTIASHEYYDHRIMEPDTDYRGGTRRIRKSHRRRMRSKRTAKKYPKNN
jgi:hypothetical protein